MPIEEDAPTADAAEARRGGRAARTRRASEEREKVIVRSNGVVTYVGKDIAYQFWKLGLLGRDFHYRLFATRPNGRVLWATTPTTAGDASHPPFGRAARDLQRHRRRGSRTCRSC